MTSNTFTPRHPPKTVPGRPEAWQHKARELTLHDTLDRLEDFTLQLAFQSHACQFEILSITPPADDRPAAPASADDTVVSLDAARIRKSA